LVFNDETLSASWIFAPMSQPPKNLVGLEPESLASWLAERDVRSFRLKQILDWVYRKGASRIDEMTDLSKDLREALAAEFALGHARVAGKEPSQDGLTVKYLLELRDEKRVECVLMVDARRTSVCLSSQAGCAMGCAFCATGATGPGRNLKADEICEQAWRMGRDAGGFTNVVFMGMGEPLRNLDAVMAAMQALVDERRFGVGGRRITLSTCGLVSGIRELARAPVQPHLALSLNSPFEDERIRLMSGTAKHPLSKLLPAVADYIEETGRKLTFEYVLLKGVNDTRPHARALAELARDMKARINLIPYNPVRGAPFKPPTPEEVDTFRHWLEVSRAPVSIRYRRGQDIAAGCGQLRAKDGSARRTESKRRRTRRAKRR
jgi:23S rRNA (adenine2503-C2)-methyltransferase